MMTTWTDLQHEHKDWVQREYPSQFPYIPAAGIVEEAGELMRAQLKTVEWTVWGPDGRYPNLRELLADSIGDVAIYACSFCNAVSWDFSELMYHSAHYTTDVLTPLEWCRSLVAAAAEFMQQPYTRSKLLMVLIRLRGAAKSMEVEFEHAVYETWKQVRTRRRRPPLPPRPKIVCLCGSTRFWRTFQEASLSETLAGNIVLSIGAARSADDHDKTFGGYCPIDKYDAVKQQLDELHKRKIELADEVLVLNAERRYCRGCHEYMDNPCGAHPHHVKYDPQCGWEMRPYIGDSTRSEIAHAEKLGKPVRYLCEL